MYPVEDIPNPDKLFCRVHQNNIVEGELTPVAFREQGEGSEKGLSTNWEKYSNAEMVKQEARNPIVYGVMSLITGHLRYYGFNVVHSPFCYSELLSKRLVDNRSHTDVKGIEALKNRLISLDIYEWEIKPNVIVGDKIRRAPTGDSF